MADTEDIFLRAKHRTFSGLTEGSRVSLASLAEVLCWSLFPFDMCVTLTQKTASYLYYDRNINHNLNSGGGDAENTILTGGGY